MKLYPMTFKPIYKEMVWGGNRMKGAFGRDIPSDNTGESWDVSCREKEMGIVENGEYAGKLFIDVINENREAMLGKANAASVDFPLLVKIIDAKDNLSVQVHPDDKYAREKENYVFGKTEMWYILDAPEGAELIIGLADDVTKEKFAEAIKNGTVEDCLGRLPVKRGDVVNIPAGLLHAITSGIMLAEIQQNSDITYRVYDYNRVGLDGKPRELHVDKSLDVIDFDGRLSKKVLEGLSIIQDGNALTCLIENQYFGIMKYDVVSEIPEKTKGDTFAILTCVAGEVSIEYEGGSVVLSESRSAFIPAAMGEYVLKGNGTIMYSYATAEREMRQVLKKLGFTDEMIDEKTYIE